MNFRATSEADHEAIAALLTRVFQAGPDNLFYSRQHQSWKYWQPRSGWEGSRSFVLEQDRKLLAHGCVWPLPIRGADRAWNGIYLIDWAADPAAPAGVGIALLRRIAALGDAVCAIGGSEMTRAIMPKIGFRPYNEMWFGARPLRPLRQAATHQSRDWKLPARLVRNAVRAWLPPARPPQGWSAAPCPAEEIPEHLWPQPQAELAVGARQPGLFRYLQKSPWADFAFFQVSRNGALAGYFCLSFAVGQARIADLWLPSRSPGDWAAAYLLAIGRAKQRWSNAAEITASSAVPWGQEALALAGFRIFAQDPITFYGAHGFPGTSQRFHLQMVDADFCFLHTGAAEYRT
jgi:hypothetical protein